MRNSPFPFSVIVAHVPTSDQIGNDLGRLSIAFSANPHASSALVQTFLGFDASASGRLQLTPAGDLPARDVWAEDEWTRSSDFESMPEGRAATANALSAWESRVGGRVMKKARFFGLASPEAEWIVLGRVTEANDRAKTDGRMKEFIRSQCARLERNELLALLDAAAPQGEPPFRDSDPPAAPAALARTKRRL